MGRPREFNEEVALSSAMNVFWENGFNQASMQELCSAMDINPGSLYTLFGSKDALFIAAINQYISLVTDEGISRLKNENSGITGIRDYFEYIVDGIITGRRCNGCFGTNTFLELGEKNSEIQNLMKDHFSFLEKEFENALVRDGIENANDHAYYLVCFAQGLNVLARTSPKRATLNTLVSTTLKPIMQLNAA